MNKMQLKAIFTDLSKAARKHSPEILTGIGIAGMLSTTILAVRATPKALILIEDKKREKKFAGEQPELTKVEIIKTAWKLYIPAVVTGVVSIASLVGASSVNARRNAALAAAYALSETTLSDYKDKVAETFGEKKAQQVDDAVAKEQLERTPVVEEDILDTGHGKTRCFEPYSGRYFWSDIEFIRRAVNNLNERLLFDEHISLNEYYDEIGLEETSSITGEALGWTVDPDSSNKGLIELKFSSQLDSNRQPCLVVNFVNPPVYEYCR